MADTDLDSAAWLKAMSALLDLPVADEYRPGVIANLEVVARFAKTIVDFPLDDHEEPALVFAAGLSR